MRSKRLQREIDTLVAQGWRIEDEDTDRVVMVDREFGSFGSHLVVAFFTIWWTMGLGNVAWGAYKYLTQSRRRILWEEGIHAGCPNCGADVAPDAGYCLVCGVDLEEAQSDAELGLESATGTRGASGAESTATCPECDALVTSGSRYCSACGTNLADAMAGTPDA